MRCLRDPALACLPLGHCQDEVHKQRATGTRHSPGGQEPDPTSNRSVDINTGVSKSLGRVWDGGQGPPESEARKGGGSRVTGPAGVSSFLLCGTSRLAGHAGHTTLGKMVTPGTLFPVTARSSIPVATPGTAWLPQLVL